MKKNTIKNFKYFSIFLAMVSNAQAVEEMGIGIAIHRAYTLEPIWQYDAAFKEVYEKSEALLAHDNLSQQDLPTFRATTQAWIDQLYTIYREHVSCAQLLGNDIEGRLSREESTTLQKARDALGEEFETTASSYQAHLDQLEQDLNASVVPHLIPLPPVRSVLLR